LKEDDLYSSERCCGPEYLKTATAGDKHHNRCEDEDETGYRHQPSEGVWDPVQALNRGYRHNRRQDYTNEVSASLQCVCLVLPQLTNSEVCSDVGWALVTKFEVPPRNPGIRKPAVQNVRARAQSSQVSRHYGRLLAVDVPRTGLEVSQEVVASVRAAKPIP